MRRFILIFSLLAWPMLSAFAADDAKLAPEPKRYAFYPSFVTNLAHPMGKSFMQVRVNAYTVDPVSEGVLAANEPLLRDKILLILNEQKPADMRSEQGREQLSETVKAAINELLQQQAPDAKVVKVNFDRVIVE